MVKASVKTRMLEAFRFRMYFFISVVSVVFIILLIQIINLQLVNGEEYRIKSKLNMESNIPIPASRGEIYDRNFKFGKKNVVIVSNRPSFNITIVPAKFENKKNKALARKKMYNVVADVCILLKIDKKDIIKEIRTRSSWERIIIKEDVGFDTIVKIASHSQRFKNIDWEDAPIRVYNFAELFAHTIGYIGSINKKEYKKLRKYGYKRYQKIGKYGIEKQYDRYLRGKDGYIRRIVDVKNRTEGEEVGLESIAGNNIISTLDYNIQQVAFDALGEQHGSVIVLKPSTGEIIAMVSRPDYDPNEIISRDNSKIIVDLLKDKSRPFLNRAIQAKYPPASTFKLVTAIAALETEKSYPGKTYFCSGKYTLKGYRDRDFYCFKKHGKQDLYGAIAQSCSVYFYQLGYRVGPTSILKYANYFGLNSKTEIDLPGEVKGFVPSQRWKLKTYGQNWYDGDTINLSIGQGFLNVTPIGLVNLLAGIVNRGIVYKPHVLKEIRTPDNKNIIRRFEKEKLRELPLSPLTVKTIQSGMRQGVLKGSQRLLKRLKVKVAGKTGTAQTKSNRKDNRSQHAWHASFAPYDGSLEDAVVVVTMVEFGQWGSASAVPIANKIYLKLYEQGYFPKSKEK